MLLRERERDGSLPGSAGRSAAHRVRRPLGEDSHDVGRFHYEEFFAIEFDLGAGPLAEQLAIAGLDFECNKIAGLVTATRPNGNDFTLLRLLLGGIRNDNAARGLFLGINALDHHAVMQGTKLEFAHVFLVGAKGCELRWDRET